MRVGPIGVLAVGLALAGAFATGAGLGQLELPSWWTPEGKPPPREFPVLEPSRPVRISVPSIGLRAAVHGVGLADDGSIGVPAATQHQEAGWYRDSPTPGQFGPAIIVGHVDSRTGPAVFHDLREVRPGARIEISRRDGSVAIFEVNSVERFDKKHLPARRLYADFSRPSLRLITCGGRWVGRFNRIRGQCGGIRVTDPRAPPLALCP
ncbi:class F sortase [Micromonospora sp. CPCC 206061]|uniref:class F sortase n=1 Tax=Micromonospora sp. CPCC 206061 TaxID=3122410 RepID=UPI003FA57F17